MALQERMEETRRMRHDLRHHIHTISFYLEEKDYGKLTEYINAYRDSIPDGDVIRFCENRIVNNIIFYFAVFLFLLFFSQKRLFCRTFRQNSITFCFFIHYFAHGFL